MSVADLFEVDLAPSLPPEDALLEERDAERLSMLLEKQQDVGCTEAEQAEIRALVAEFSRRARELDLEEARQWWTAFQGDPDRRQAVVADLKRR
jgi:hypothetical protein